MRIVVWTWLLLAGVGTTESGASGIAYRDATEGSGLHFEHANGATGEKRYPEAIGSGACLLDADGDGILDVYCVNSEGSNRLFRGLGGLRFEDVTEGSGLADPDGYGMGAVAADYDDDGDPDVYVTNVGENRLFVNRGDGTFEEKATWAGVNDAAFGAGASFVDVDRDGRLDLYVVNYVEGAAPDTNACWSNNNTLRVYCFPAKYPPAPDVFYRNLGDGRFEDATEAAGLSGVAWRGLGVVATDYDRDGWPDLYVANDLDPNLLFRNLGDGTFEEVAFLAGTAFSEDGKPESGMGACAGDYDNDGWYDLFVTNYRAETNTLYGNEAGAFFFDRSAESGLGPQSLPWLGWGTKFFDFDRDGWLDLFVANGHTESDIAKIQDMTTWEQPDLLHRNRGDGTFEQVSADVAPPMHEWRPARGTAFGDLDDDGDIDLVVIDQLAPARLLENVSEDGNAWIGFRLRGTSANRDAVGAQLELHAGDLVQHREVRAGEGYLSSHDPRIHFGLGARAGADSLVVTWPAGERRTYQDLAPGRYHELTGP